MPFDCTQGRLGRRDDCDPIALTPASSSARTAISHTRRRLPPPPLPSACRVAARRQWLCPRGGCRRHCAVVEGELGSMSRVQWGATITDRGAGQMSMPAPGISSAVKNIRLVILPAQWAAMVCEAVDLAPIRKFILEARKTLIGTISDRVLFFQQRAEVSDRRAITRAADHRLQQQVAFIDSDDPFTDDVSE